MKKLLLYFIFNLTTTCLFTQKITTGEWKQFIPSPAIPEKIHCKNSNNNLDVAVYNGIYYVAFRTAPTHFASKKTKLFIISSNDLKSWKYETEFFVNADMREPRFAVFKNQLHFYFFEGGKKMFKFEPKHIWTSILNDTGWCTKIKTNLDGFVDWRLRTYADKLYLSAYYGINLYNDEHHANLRLFTSENGIDFIPISEQPQITTKGAEEGEFIFDKQ